jgi:hypothetical protein
MFTELPTAPWASGKGFVSITLKSKYNTQNKSLVIFVKKLLVTWAT